MTRPTSTIFATVSTRRQSSCTPSSLLHIESTHHLALIVHVYKGAAFIPSVCEQHTL